MTSARNLKLYRVVAFVEVKICCLIVELFDWTVVIYVYYDNVVVPGINSEAKRHVSI